MLESNLIVVPVLKFESRVDVGKYFVLKVCNMKIQFLNIFLKNKNWCVFLSLFWKIANF